MNFLEIIKAIGDFTVMVVICGAVIYLLVKYFSGIIDEKAKQATKKESEAIEYTSTSALKTLHPFFDKMDSLVKLKLPTIKMGGPVRTKIFKDVLFIFYEVGEEVIGELLDKTITETSFLHENKKAILELIERSTRRMVDHEIPQVVIDKFWEWNYKRHEYTMSTLSDIDSSAVFGSIVEKQYAALNLFQSAFYFVLTDAEKTLKTLNGDLTGAVYKGEVVESLHSKED